MKCELCNNKFIFYIRKQFQGLVSRAQFKFSEPSKHFWLSLDGCFKFDPLDDDVTNTLEPGEVRAYCGRRYRHGHAWQSRRVSQSYVAYCLAIHAKRAPNEHKFNLDLACASFIRTVSSFHREVEHHMRTNVLEVSWTAICTPSFVLHLYKMSMNVTTRLMFLRMLCKLFMEHESFLTQFAAVHSRFFVQ